VTWLQQHQRSEQLAAEAEIAARRGELSLARELYAQAAEAEDQACGLVEPGKTRTLGITAVSSASLHYKAAQAQIAERVAYQWLGSGSLPSFAVEQLKRLLQSIWSERVRQRAGVPFAPGEVVVSVQGGEVVEGGAPLDLIVEKVQTVQAYFFRTAELLRGLPHRRHGAPPREVAEMCRPWLFQTSPGSYQFAVAVQETRQMSLFPTADPRPREIAEHFLRILRATAEAPESELPLLVPDDDYRTTFLKLTRNLAPTGRRFSVLGVCSADEKSSLTLSPETRVAVTNVIRATRRVMPAADEVEQMVRGTLRAVHLEQDWIEIYVDAERVRITQVGEAVDDVIGPMVNHPVIVRVMRDRSGKLRFRDIETDE